MGKGFELRLAQVNEEWARHFARSDSRDHSGTAQTDATYPDSADLLSCIPEDGDCGSQPFPFLTPADIGRLRSVSLWHLAIIEEVGFGTTTSDSMSDTCDEHSDICGP